jgi:proteic killer suppression protein
MDVESIRHKGLALFFEKGNPRKLVGDRDRIAKMLAFIDAAETLDELNTPPNYGLHKLKGDRAHIWAMTVTKNWRMTFGINEEGALIDLDLEDYHGA